jgi:hypothetical protein
VQTLQPRFNGRYDVTNDIQIKAGVGLYQQYPGEQGIVPDQGNPLLGPELALQNSIGAKWQITRAISADVTTFYNYMWDLASSSNKVLIENGNPTPLLWENNEQGRIYGLELLLRVNPYKGFFGWLSYDLSRSERISPSVPYWHLYDYDQTHILTLIASYKLPRDFQIGVRFRLVSGNPVTPVVRSLFDADTGRYDAIYGAVNSARLPTFQQLDVRIDKTFVFNNWKFSIYLDVENVYNAKNPEFYQYSYDYSQRSYITGIPIFPVLGLQGEY